MSFNDLMTKNIRLVMLQLLVQGNGSLNEHLLRILVREAGFAISTDTCRTQIHWLAEQGYVTVQTTGTMIKASITARGQDVADGERVPGVERPRPEY